MLSTREILLEYISPLLGAIFANMMFFAPMKDVRRAVQKGGLGHLNPTPWAVMTGNTLGWLTYSYLLKNYFIFFANAPGFIFSIWLNLAAAKLQYCDRLAEDMRQSFQEMIESRHRRATKSFYRRANNVRNSDENNVDDSNFSLDELQDTAKQINGHGQNRNSPRRNKVQFSMNLGQSSNQIEYGQVDELSHAQHMLNKMGELQSMVMDIATERTEAPAAHEKVVLSIIVAWFAFISCIVFVPMDTTRREFVIGIAVNLNMSFFYGAPLSIIFKVIKTNDSSSIHRDTMIMNTLCATFFLAFGIGRMDYFLIVPNAIGVILGGVQLFLRLVVPCSENSTQMNNSVRSKSALNDEELNGNANHNSDPVSDHLSEISA